jgi:hypothetical protein
VSTELGQRYFEEIKEIWRPFESAAESKGKYIIPFCTPIVLHPPALVIGKHHTDFHPKDIEKARDIARRFSRSVPTVNTYIVHDHHFAVGLQRICEGARIDITEDWVGTNRCAVQWEAGKKNEESIEQIRVVNPRAFDECQKRMDQTLIRFVDEICPRNVVLVGEYARDLFYDKKKPGQTYDDFPPQCVECSGQSSKALIIAVPNPNWPRHQEIASAILRKHWRK